jgi:hypothetical protein
MAENSVAEPIKRGAGRPFAPGVSGNPGGRPKGVEEVQRLAREHTASAIQTLIGIAKGGKFPAAARVSAASVLLDRGWGKPVQPTEHSGELVQRVISGEPLTQEQWAQKYATDKSDAV